MPPENGGGGPPGVGVILEDSRLIIRCYPLGVHTFGPKH